jgi:hypothetical protein
MMNTTEMLNTAVEHVKAVIDDKRVYVRTSSVSKVSGRCLFDFSGLDSHDIAIGVVFKKKSPVAYYVIPGRLCPKVLLVKPGSEDSKWHPYYCDAGDQLGSFVRRMLDHKVPKSIINKFA